MIASEWEFRYRFWLNGFIFCLGFALYAFDRQNAAVALNGALRSFGGNFHWPVAPVGSHLAFAFASLFVAASAVLRTWAAAYLQTTVVRDVSVRTDALVADGPYRHIRNPLYFANIFTAIGVGLLASRLGFFVIVFGQILYHWRLIGREELALHGSQLHSYEMYCRRVPAFWPSLLPRIPKGKLEPNWRQAVRGEASLYVLAVAIAGFAATLSLAYAYVVFGLLFLINMFLLPLWRRLRKRSHAV